METKEGKIVKIDYDDMMCAINAMMDLSKMLEPYGLKLVQLDGGDGYDEFELIQLNQ